jgi:hypothetical protein
MTRETVCPSCGRTLRVPEQALGQSVQCPACEVVFTAAPAPAPAPAPTPRVFDPPPAPDFADRAAPPPPAERPRPAAAEPPDASDEADSDDEAPPRPRLPYALHPALHVALATAVSVGPLGGCAVLAVNYLRRRRAVAAGLVLLAGLAGTVGLLWAARDESNPGRGLVLALLCLPLMHLLAVALQGRDYSDYLEQGGGPAPLRRAFVLGVLALLLQVGLHAALSLLFPAVFPLPLPPP